MTHARPPRRPAPRARARRRARSTSGARSSSSASSPSSSTTTAARSGTGAHTAAAAADDDARARRGRASHARGAHRVGCSDRERQHLAALALEPRARARRARAASADRSRASTPPARAVRRSSSRRSPAATTTQQPGVGLERRARVHRGLELGRGRRRRTTFGGDAARRNVAQRSGPAPRGPPAQLDDVGRRPGRRRPRARRAGVGVASGWRRRRRAPSRAPADRAAAPARSCRSRTSPASASGTQVVERAVDRGDVGLDPARPASRVTAVRRAPRRPCCSSSAWSVRSHVKSRLAAAEVPVRRGLLVDRPAQVEPLDDRRRAQVEVLLHEAGQLRRGRSPTCRTSRPSPTPGARRRSRTRPAPRSAWRCPAATTFFATWRTAYAAERSTFVGSLPLNAPPPWRAMPP